MTETYQSSNLIKPYYKPAGASLSGDVTQAKGTPEKKGGSFVDTISTCQPLQNLDTKTLAFSAPTLVPGNNSGDNSADYMKELCEAYIAIFRQLGTGLQQQISMQNNLVGLDQTMSQIVVDSAQKQMQDALKQASLIKQAQEEQSKGNEVASIFEDICSFGLAPLLRISGVSEDTIKWVTIGVSVGFLLVGLAITVGTGGFGAGLEASILATDIGEAIGAAADGISSVKNLLTGGELLEGAEEGGEAAGQVGELTETSQSIFTAQNVKALSIDLAKRSFGMFLAAVFQSPQLVNCIVGTKIAGYKDELAKTQRKLGNDTAFVQLNSSFYRFYQQLVQRGADNSQQLISQLGSVTQTFSSTTKAYKAIAQGLAQAV